MCLDKKYMHREDEMGMSKQKSYKKASKAQVFMLFIMIAMIIVIGIVGYRLFVNNEDIHEDDVVLEEIREEVVKEDISYDYELKSGVVIPDDNMVRVIDFDTLYAASDNVYGWVYIPDTHIDHYVMQEQKVGETYYLWRDIYGKSNRVGSIFTPAIPDIGIEDAHTLIFGHRLIDKTQGFSDLKNFRDEAYAMEHQYVYLYFKDHVERWKAWTVNWNNIMYNDMVYEIPFELETDSYQNLLNHVQDTATLVLSDAPSNTDKTLVLSTCYGPANSDYRLYVSYSLSAVYYYDTQYYESY